MKKFIINLVNDTYYLVIYYTKYHAELNYIKHFLYSTKKQVRKIINISLKIFNVVFLEY